MDKECFTPLHEAFDTVLAALKRAREGLYNGFEPDNQSRLYRDVDDVIKAAGRARASFSQSEKAATTQSAGGDVDDGTGEKCSPERRSDCRSQPLAGPSSETAEWLIWSNEHRAWWGHDRCGYRETFETAGRYTFSEAHRICRSRHWADGKTPPETMIHIDEVLYAG